MEAEARAVGDADHAEMDQPPPTFSADALHKAQGELAVFTDSSRTILLHICERLARLEHSLRTVQFDVARIQGEVAKGTNEIKHNVIGVQDQVLSLSARLGDVASVVDHFQLEINSQRQSVTTLSTSIDGERDRIIAVDFKVDNQREEFDTRLLELNLKLDEIPKALAALQKPGSRDPFAGFTFRAAERDKLSMEKHIHRKEAGNRRGGPPYTDLQPFTIPEDMKKKIEMKIRQKEQSKVEADKCAAIELADAYRRLQLAGYPRVTEIHMHVEQCREEIKRAFEYIETTNLQLYASCESKVERVDLRALQAEVKALRSRLREVELLRTGGSGKTSKPETESVGPSKMGEPSAWNLDKYFVMSVDTADRRVCCVVAAQVPELRVSLLEMTRNLTALRQQWAKTNGQPLNGVVKQHLEKLIALLTDGYSSTAEEPVDLERVAEYVDKIARLLASDFSQQILRMMHGPPSPLRSHGAKGEVVKALDRYSQAFTDAVTMTQAIPVKGSGGAHHATTMRVINDQKKQLKKLQDEVERLSESQRSMEMTLGSSVIAASGSIADGVTASLGDDSTRATTTLQLAAHQQQLQTLQDQVFALRRHTMQQEDAYTELIRQFDQWRKDRTPIGALVGQRMSGAPPGTHSTSPLPSSLRRSNSGNISSSSDLDAYLALTSVDQGDHLKSQANRLDPLVVQKVESKPPKTAISIRGPVARNGMLHKIQTRAQAMRPKSGHGDGHPAS